MEDRAEVSRRQVVRMAGLITVAAAAAMVPERAAAGPGRERVAARKPSEAPCIGEPGYEARVARLFGHGDRRT